MKKLVRAITVCVLALCFSQYAQAQIKMFPNNKLMVGPQWWTSYPSAQDFYVFSSMEIQPYPAASINIKNYHNQFNGVWYDDPSIVPYFNAGSWLGTPDREFWAVHTRYLYIEHVLQTSDERYKTNIKPLESAAALQKVLAMKTYSYDYDASCLKDTKESDKQRLEESGKDQLGFMAQELKEILPQVVKQGDADGKYSVNYIAVIPVLVEAIKAQQAKIEELEKRISNTAPATTK